MRRIMRNNRWNNGRRSDIQRAEEMVIIYELRLTGMTHRAISDALAQRNPPIIMDHTTVGKWISSDLDQRVQPARDHVRQVELDRLDHYLVKLDAGVEAGDEKAINTALRVGERRAKLLGIDAPIQVDALVGVTTAGSELQELLAAAKQRELAKEAAIIEGEIIGDTLGPKGVHPFTSTESQE